MKSAAVAGGLANARGSGGCGSGESALGVCPCRSAFSLLRQRTHNEPWEICKLSARRAPNGAEAGWVGERRGSSGGSLSVGGRRLRVLPRRHDGHRRCATTAATAEGTCSCHLGRRRCCWPPSHSHTDSLLSDNSLSHPSEYQLLNSFICSGLLLFYFIIRCISQYVAM
jgi:hypothetical protein